MAEQEKTRRVSDIFNTVKAALAEAGLPTKDRGDEWQMYHAAFTISVERKYSFEQHVNLSVMPHYHARQGGGKGATLRIKDGEDVAPKITRAVERAAGFVQAATEYERKERENSDYQRKAQELKRVFAETHFPDFTVPEWGATKITRVVGRLRVELYLRVGLDDTVSISRIDITGGMDEPSARLILNEAFGEVTPQSVIENDRAVQEANG